MVVLFHSGGYGQDIRVEYDVVWVVPNLIDEKIVGASAYLDFTL